jgi:hypothetical protein
MDFLHHLKMMIPPMAHQTLHFFRYFPMFSPLFLGDFPAMKRLVLNGGAVGIALRYALYFVPTSEASF